VFLPQCFISLKHGLMYRGVNVWLISMAWFAPVVNTITTVHDLAANMGLFE